jgi:hypothetical protein
LRDLRRAIRDARTGLPLLSSSSLGGNTPFLSPNPGGGGVGDEYAWNSRLLGGRHGQEEEEEEEENLTWEEILQQDEKFANMVTLLDDMNRRAKEALSKTVQSEVKSIGGRVLNHFSMPSMSSEHEMEHEEDEEEGMSLDTSRTTGMKTSTTTTVSASSRKREKSNTISNVSNDDSTEDEEAGSTSIEESGVEGESTEQSSSSSNSFDVSKAISTNSEFSISID